MPFSKQQPQKRNRSRSTYHPPPLFWNNLPKLWLTKSALKEAHRQNQLLCPSQTSFPNSYTFASDFLRGCSATSLQEIRRSSRCGGQDLADIRNYPAPAHLSQSSINPTNSNPTPMTGKATVYDRNFEEHLLDHGVFLPLSTYPDGTEPPEPENLAEIQRRLQAPRPSRVISPDSLKKEYKEFTRVNSRAVDEQLVIKDILPILEGKPDASSSSQNAGGHDFTNLAPLTDGTLAHAKPDIYYGARANQLEPAIQKQLSDQIIPSTQGNRPVAPNFFVEVQGLYGSVPVAMRQACYDGALGARALYALQVFGNGNTTYDNKAYTLMCTYQSGCLGIYATHPTRSRSNNTNKSSTDYVMTQVGQWALHGDPETYQRGVTAYQNARDLTTEYRDTLIKQANERCSAGQDHQFHRSQPEPPDHGAGILAGSK